MTALTSDPAIAGALAALSLEQKVQLLTGHDFWTTWPIEKIGLRRILVSDGPSGVRGETCDERDPSLNLPSATALASSWDPDVGEALPVTVEVENRGARDGKQIVQIYAERADSAVDRPVRWLVGFAPARVPAGERAQVLLNVPTRLLAYWQDGWRYEPGAYQLRAGTSAVDLPLAANVELT